jgi:DNA-binding response OmpR family regulator
MVNGYINLDKEHSDFLTIFKNIGIKKLALKKVNNQNEVDIVLTSLSKYGETKKNLSDIESSSKPIPTLIISNNKEFDQTIDLIRNDQIEVVSNKSRVSEINARINSLIGDSSSEKLEFRDLVINLKTYEAKIDNELLDLTYMEYELLKFFIENQENVWSREELLEKVWGYDYFGGARTVDVHVRRLRSKLGEKRLDWIKTVHSVGYKFN